MASDMPWTTLRQQAERVIQSRRVADLWDSTQQHLRDKYRVDPVLVPENFVEVSHEALKSTLDAATSRMFVTARIGHVEDAAEVRETEGSASSSELVLSENLTRKSRELVYLSIGSAGPIFVGLHLAELSKLEEKERKLLAQTGTWLRGTGLTSQQLNTQLPLRRATYTEWIGGVGSSTSLLRKEWELQCENDQFSVAEGAAESAPAPLVFRLEVGQSVWLDLQTGAEEELDISADQIAPLAELQKEVRHAEELQTQFLHFVHEKYNSQIKRLSLTMQRLQPEIKTTELEAFVKCLNTPGKSPGIRDCVAEIAASTGAPLLPVSSAPTEMDLKDLLLKVTAETTDYTAVVQALKTYPAPLGQWDTWKSYWMSYLHQNDDLKHCTTKRNEFLAYFGRFLWNSYPSFSDSFDINPKQDDALQTLIDKVVDDAEAFFYDTTMYLIDTKTENELATFYAAVEQVTYVQEIQKGTSSQKNVTSSQDKQLLGYAQPYAAAVRIPQEMVTWAKAGEVDKIIFLLGVDFLWIPLVWPLLEPAWKAVLQTRILEKDDYSNAEKKYGELMLKAWTVLEDVKREYPKFWTAIRDARPDTGDAASDTGAMLNHPFLSIKNWNDIKTDTTNGFMKLIVEGQIKDLQADEGKFKNDDVKTWRSNILLEKDVSVEMLNEVESATSLDEDFKKNAITAILYALAREKATSSI